MDLFSWFLPKFVCHQCGHREHTRDDHSDTVYSQLKSFIMVGCKATKLYGYRSIAPYVQNAIFPQNILTEVSPISSLLFPPISSPLFFTSTSLRFLLRKKKNRLPRDIHITLSTFWWEKKLVPVGSFILRMQVRSLWTSLNFRFPYWARPVVSDACFLLL